MATFLKSGFQSALLAGTVFLSGCGTPDAVAPAATEAPQAAPVAAPIAAAPMRLPISLNALMVALVNHSADPIWLAAWRNPASDKDWRNLERMAYQLEVAGALLVIPGTGPEDDAWVTDAGWQVWSNKLREAGARAVVAVQQRDIEQISAVGDQIVDICEGCHYAFKPDLPTGGLFGELSPTEADFQGETPESETP